MRRSSALVDRAERARVAAGEAVGRREGLLREVVVADRDRRAAVADAGMVGIDIGRACVAEDLAGEARKRCRVLPTVGDAEVVEVALVELGAALAGDEVLDRSEERRVGKGWVSTCRSGGAPNP